MMRETGGMTLTEFLLARIAEDEADARVLAVGMGPPVTSNPIDHPTRVLAECEAKRQIVDEHGIECWPDEGGGDWYGCETCPTETVPHPSEMRCPTLMTRPDYVVVRASLVNPC